MLRSQRMPPCPRGQPAAFLGRPNDPTGSVCLGPLGARLPRPAGVSGEEVFLQVSPSQWSTHVACFLWRLLLARRKVSPPCVKVIYTFAPVLWECRS